MINTGTQINGFRKKAKKENKKTSPKYIDKISFVSGYGELLLNNYCPIRRPQPNIVVQTMDQDIFYIS